MTIDELRDEYERDTVGQAITAFVADCVRRAVQTYDPAVYADSGSWDDSAREDVVQDVLADQFLRDGQVHYIFAIAETAEDLRRLVGRQVRRALARRRRRTVVDQLLSRSRSILDSQHVGGERDGKPVWAVDGASLNAATPSHSEIRRAGANVRSLKRVRSDASERAPMVYDTPTLEILLRSVLRELTGPISLGQLDVVFHEVLTGWVPGVLDKSSDTTSVASLGLGPDEELVVTDVADRLYAALDDDDRVVLRMKLAGQSDGDLAQALRVSRPTAAKRKAHAWATVGEYVKDLPERQRQAVIDALTLDIHRQP
jgi:hypothetical protein